MLTETSIVYNTSQGTCPVLIWFLGTDKQTNEKKFRLGPLRCISHWLHGPLNFEAVPLL